METAGVAIRHPLWDTLASRLSRFGLKQRTPAWARVKGGNLTAECEPVAAHWQSGRHG